MRGYLFGIGLLAACYAPRLPAGAQCMTDSQCPIEQRCVVDRCGYGDADAGTSDTAIAVDTVMDSAPGCVLRGHDEDGDGIDDGCDACPIAGPTVADDPDGDHVSSGCDPHPGVAGDQILKFDGLQAASTDWLLGSAAFGNDVITLAPSPDQDVGIEGQFDANDASLSSVSITVSLGFQALASEQFVEMVVGNNNDNTGVLCVLGADTSTTLLLVLSHSPTGNDSIRSFPKTSTTHVLTLRREGGAYQCSVVEGDMTYTSEARVVGTDARPALTIGASNENVSSNLNVQVRSVLIVGK